MPYAFCFQTCENMKFSHFTDIEVENGYYSFLPRNGSLLDSSEENLTDEQYQQFGFIQHATTIDAARNILRYF